MSFTNNIFVLQAGFKLGLICAAFVTQNTPFLNNAEFRQFPVSVVKTLTNVHDYLETHRKHINYKRFKELGLPLGSGIVESACKWLIQQRFKGVGMRSP